MTESLLPFASGVLIGVILGLILAGQNRRRIVVKRNHGVDAINEQRRVAKLQAKQQIVDYFLRQEQVRNQDVEQLLNVSDTTATNYLNELATERMVIRHGDRGRGVFYTLNMKEMK